MALVTLLTSQTVAVLADVTQVTGTLPVGKRLVGVFVLNTSNFVEELGVNGTNVNGTVLTTHLNGSDTVGGQHSIVYQFAEDIDIIAAGTETVTTLIDNGDGTYNYTSENGTVTVVRNVVTSLANNGDGTYTYTSEDGTTTVVRDIVTTLVSNGGGSYTYTSEDGTVTNLQLIGGGTETTTSLTDNGDGTFTYTNEAGTPVTFSALSTLEDNGDGTLSYVDERGNVVTFTANNIISEFVEAARYQICTTGFIPSCKCPCGGDLPIEVGDDVWFYLTNGDTVRGSIVEASRNYQSDRKSTRLNSSHKSVSRMPSSA